MGGSYMTLLNTVANLGGSWPQPTVLWLVQHFTVTEQPCTVSTRPPTYSHTRSHTHSLTQATYPPIYPPTYSPTCPPTPRSAARQVGLHPARWFLPAGCGLDHPGGVLAARHGADDPQVNVL